MYKLETKLFLGYLLVKVIFKATKFQVQFNQVWKECEDGLQLLEGPIAVLTVQFECCQAHKFKRLKVDEVFATATIESDVFSTWQMRKNFEGTFMQKSSTDACHLRKVFQILGTIQKYLNMTLDQGGKDTLEVKSLKRKRMLRLILNKPLNMDAKNTTA